MATRRNERRLEVRITSEAKQFDRGFRDAQRTTQSFSQQLDQASKGGISRFNSGMDISLSRVRGFIGLVGGAVAGGALLRWAGQARESANLLTESINAVNVVFGEAADKVLDFGEKAAESVGLANSEFNQLVVPIGSLLQNFGFSADEAADATLDLTQRAADLASVFNTDVSEALGAIQAALRGESDPIERFGASISAARVESFLLSEGIVESKNAITDADKVLGRYRLILEDTARVSGDFANTSDENANATRIFQARLEDLQAQAGKAIIPVFNELVGAGNDLLPVLESLGTDVLPVVVDAFGDFLAGVGAIVETIGALPGPVKAVTGGVLGLAAAAKLLYANPIIAGLGLVAAGIAAIGDEARRDKEAVDKLVVALQEARILGSEDPIRTAVEGDILELLRDGAKIRFGFDIDAQELQEGFRRLGVNRNTLIDFVIGDQGAITAVEDALDRIFERGRLDPAVLGDARQASQFVGQLRDLQGIYSDAQSEANRLLDAERDLADEGELADKIIQQQARAQFELNDARGEGAELSEEAAEALAAEKERADELTAGVRELAEAYAKDLNDAALEYLTIFEGVEEVDPVQGVDQLLANVEGRVEVISSFLAGLSRLRDEGLFDLALEFQSQGVSAQNVAELESVIADIDRGGSTAFELNETLAAAEDEIGRITAAMGLRLAREQQPLLEDAQRLGVSMGEAIAQGLERVALNFSLRVGAASTGGGGGGRRGGGGVRPLASGGRFYPDETLVVGEYRPEVVQFDRGGVVYPSVSDFLGSVERGGFGPGGNSYTFNIPMESTGDAYQDAQRVGFTASVLRRMEASL